MSKAAPAGGRDRRLLGRKGERLAAKHLRRAGYRILNRNLRIGHDEADLVALDPDGSTIVIVEVKTLAGAATAPEMKIDRGKQYRMARLAARLQQMRRYRDRPIRFDAVAVHWPADGRPDVRHYPGAFQSPV
jgi:putative endonuclease